MDIKTKRRNQYRAKHGIPLDAPLHSSARGPRPHTRKDTVKIMVTVSPEVRDALDARAGSRSRGDVIAELLAGPETCPALIDTLLK